jgi:hypothetical protein
MPPFEMDCPYCGEPIDLFVDESEGAQDYVEDCAVCCRPIQVRLRIGDHGEPAIALFRDDDA